jgi:hypothetical protein
MTGYVSRIAPRFKRFITAARRACDLGNRTRNLRCKYVINRKFGRIYYCFLEFHYPTASKDLNFRNFSMAAMLERP